MALTISEARMSVVFGANVKAEIKYETTVKNSGYVLWIIPSSPVQSWQAVGTARSRNTRFFKTVEAALRIAREIGFSEVRVFLSPDEKTTTELTDEQREALRDYAAKHGENWRDSLRRLWVSGADSGLLRQIRNRVGPVKLEYVEL